MDRELQEIASSLSNYDNNHDQLCRLLAELVQETRKAREVSEKHLEYFTKYHCPPESTRSEIQPERESEAAVEEVITICNFPYINHKGKFFCSLNLHHTGPHK